MTTTTKPQGQAYTNQEERAVRMTQEQMIELYRDAVERLLKAVTSHPDTSGGRAAAQVLLGTYNGYNYHMDLVDLVYLDPENLRAAIHVIQLRTLTSREPHNLVANGAARFLALENAFKHLRVDQRYSEHYPGGKAAAPASHVRPAPEYYARIHPGSKYANQDDGKPFRVRLNSCPTDGYLWRGGIGGQYRHSDLQLFAKSDGELYPLPPFAAGESLQVVDQILERLEKQAVNGDLYPDWATTWSSDVIGRLNSIARCASDNWQEEC